MSSNDLDWTRFLQTVSCGYYFFLWNDDSTTKRLIILIPYSYNRMVIVKCWIKKIYLPGYFTIFGLFAAKNFADVRRNRGAEWRYLISPVIKNIIFVSKSFCHRPGFFTSWINITIIKSDVLKGVSLGFAHNCYSVIQREQPLTGSVV